MVRQGMGLRSEPGMLRSPLYVLECDSSCIIGLAFERQVTLWIKPN